MILFMWNLEEINEKKNIENENVTSEFMWQ